MAKIKSKNYLQNKLIVATIISTIIFCIVTVISIEYIPFFGTTNFTGVLIKEANLGIRNIFISRFGGNTTTNNAITIVAIDNKTLSDTEGLGRFQNFKRDYYARVINNLKKDGAIVIGLDILFSERSEDDKKLAQSIKNAGNIILGFSLAENLLPIPEFLQNALSIGYFHPKLNEYNSIVYSIIPMNIQRRESWEAFSFSVVRKYLDIIYGKKSLIDSKDIAYVNGLKSYILRDKFIPFASDKASDVYINYIPKSSRFQQISFVDAYNRTYKSDIVKDKIILIGSTATALYDKFNTPLGVQDGIYIHANMINTILNGAYIVEVEERTEILFIIVLTFFLALFTLFAENRIYQLVSSFIGLIILLFGEIFYFVTFHKLFTHPVELLIIVFLVAIFVTGYKYIWEEKGKRLLRSTLSQYLAEDLVVNILENYEEVKLGGERKTITSFFSDIAGFTSISENMEPEELVHFLSIYLKEVSDIIMSQKGFINKYEGDAVMALWGAFGHEEKQAILACRAAIEQQDKIRELNIQFKKDHGFEIGVRMGINKGDAVVGNIGSSGKKIEYTALGDSVNTASRFEGINKVYGTLICVGESVAEEAKELFVFRKLDNIQVKGKEKPVLIYELVGTKDGVTGEQIAMIQRFEEALALYVEGQFEEALIIFTTLSQTHADGPSQTFMKRCEILKGDKPENWTGVFRAKEK